MPPPELIVEVVSPGKCNEEQDYLEKLSDTKSAPITPFSFPIVETFRWNVSAGFSGLPKRGVRHPDLVEYQERRVPEYWVIDPL